MQWSGVEIETNLSQLGIIQVGSTGILYATRKVYDQVTAEFSAATTLVAALAATILVAAAWPPPPSWPPWPLKP